ncbi:arginine repressor [Leuconostoc pseudomesenteroides]|uniref:arginine repressor n=1 Tax=Leuconostoc pseudomesenteroides TaxID=33968 RepID=UPI00345EE4FB
MISKQKRQEMILDIIQHQTISNQEDLLSQLNGRGVETTQTTISRDIRALNIVRQKDSVGQLRYQQLQETTVEKTEKGSTTAVDEAIKEYAYFAKSVAFMTIVKTTDGSGNAVAGIIDDANLPEVVATLAGFNTIYVTSTTAQSAEQLANHWAALIG